MQKSILLTGATGKLGKVFVDHFLKSGYEVIAIGRSSDKLKELQDMHISNANLLKIIQLDLSLSKCGEDLLNNLKKKNLFPNILINNARSLDNLVLNENNIVSDSAFINELKLAVISPYSIVMNLLRIPSIKLKSVVNISSIYGIVAPNLNLYNSPDKESFIHYGVAKASLIHLTKELAVRLADHSIRINCIAYGGIEGRVDDAFKKRYSKLCPSGSMLKESDLLGAMDLLISDKSKGINGHTIVVDGGWTIW